MALSRATKESRLEALRTELGGAESVILVDFKGLDGPQVTDLRRKVRGAQGSYRVVKNSIARRAMEGTSFEALCGRLEGTNALAYSSDDPVALAKALVDFAKDAPALTFRAGVVQGQTIEAEGVTGLSELPGKPELQAKLLMLLNAPATNLVRLLSAAPRNLLTVLNQVEQKKKAQEEG